MASIEEMALAHLLNVKQQLEDLENQRVGLEKDIQTLSDYLQQGVVELESVGGSSETEVQESNEEEQGE